jgi:hypothetical protein
VVIGCLQEALKMKKENGSMKTSNKSELNRGASEEDAERIAAATTNKTRKEKGETKE